MPPKSGDHSSCPPGAATPNAAVDGEGPAFTPKSAAADAESAYPLLQRKTPELRFRGFVSLWEKLSVHPGSFVRIDAKIRIFMRRGI